MASVPAVGRCAGRSDCAAPALATNASYIVVAGDVGFRLRIRVTAGNVDGTNAAVSNATQAVTAQAAGPTNTAPPTIKGTTVVGEALTADPGTWSRPVPRSRISGRVVTRPAPRAWTSRPRPRARTRSSRPTRADAPREGHGDERERPNPVTSAQTGVVTTGSAPPARAAPRARGRSTSTTISPPATALDRQAADHTEPGDEVDADDPDQVARVGVQRQPVEGALVYATPTPYQQFAATEQPTGADGWAVLTMRQLRFFPASNQQQLLVVFVRARKDGEDLLAGISTRRLISFKVNLSGDARRWRAAVSAALNSLTSISGGVPLGEGGALGGGSAERSSASLGR